MLMSAIAHGGCTDTVREHALRVDSSHRGLEPASALRLAFQSDVLPVERLCDFAPYNGSNSTQAEKHARCFALLGSLSAFIIVMCWWWSVTLSAGR